MKPISPSARVKTSAIPQLEQLGYSVWKEESNERTYTICLNKKLEKVYPTCQTNEKLYINLYGYIFDHLNNPGLTWEIQIRGETVSNDWVDIKFYSILDKDLINNLPDLEDRLIRMWKQANI